MITLGSTKWTDTLPSITLTFSYEKRRSGADMQYRANVSIATMSGTSYFGYPIYLKLTIGNTLRTTQTLKEASPNKWSSAISYTSDWYTVANKTSGTTPVSFNVYSGQGSSRSGTYSYSMAVDPAASALSVSNGTLGTALTLNLTRYNDSYTDTITYTCGTASGQVVSGNKAATVSWGTSNGNTVALASQNTKGQSVEVTFTVTTYSGSTVVDTNTKKVTMSIPNTVKPSVSLGVTDATGYLSAYGAYVQGFSKLKITATPTLAYGSPIKTYAITAAGASYSTSPVTTPAIQSKGKLTITAKVTDQRERPSDQVSTEITVLEYSKPVVNLEAYRCNSDGTVNDEGAYMMIRLTSTISSLNSKNSADYVISYKNASGQTVDITGSGTSYTSPTPIACDVSKMHTVSAKVTDKLGNTPATATVPIAFTLIDYHSSGKGVAFGKVGTREGFDCAMPAYFSGGVEVGGKSLLNLIYPVGSIYMSVNNVSPATFFGGTWVQIKDTFLLAAGTTYSAGATGGSATHKLSLSELPVHGHNVGESGNTSNVYTSKKSTVASGTYASLVTSASVYIDDSNTTYRMVTSNVGNGDAHNNMPPYLTVYMWKRTA